MQAQNIAVATPEALKTPSIATELDELAALPMMIRLTTLCFGATGVATAMF